MRAVPAEELRSVGGVTRRRGPQGRKGCRLAEFRMNRVVSKDGGRSTVPLGDDETLRRLTMVTQRPVGVCRYTKTALSCRRVLQTKPGDSYGIASGLLYRNEDQQPLFDSMAI